MTLQRRLYGPLPGLTTSISLKSVSRSVRRPLTAVILPVSQATATISHKTQ